jgi:Domain of unknown function (DUF4331)
MRSPTSLIRCASHLPGRGRPPRCAGWRARRLQGQERVGKIIVEGAPVSTAREAHVTHGGDYRFFAGWRSDPFFFDTRGAINNFQFTGEDFFAVRDVCSIVLEAPNSVLGPNEVGLWARTLIKTGGGWVQADRGARPSQTPFLAGEQNSAYRAAEPANDAQFIPVFAHALEHTGAYMPEEARRVGGDNAARPHALQRRASSILSEQRQDAHRRRG